MKTIETERDLINFLKKVAQKSVIDASNLFEADSYVAKFANELEKELDILGEQEGEEEADAEPEAEAEEEAEGEEEEGAEEEEPAAEEEPEEEEEPAAEEEPEEEEAAEDQPKKPKKNPAAEKALSLPGYEMDQNVEFDQILTAINLVRAGNSTKAKKTKGEIETYFNRLDKEEKSVLAIYLKELAKIMTGAIEAEDAQDPSDPSTYFDIIVKRGGEQQAKKQAAATPEPAQQQQAPVKQMAGEEDVTPPIRVNEQQDYTGLKIIRG